MERRTRRKIQSIKILGTKSYILVLTWMTKSIKIMKMRRIRMKEDKMIKWIQWLHSNLKIVFRNKSYRKPYKIKFQIALNLMEDDARYFEWSVNKVNKRIKAINTLKMFLYAFREQKYTEGIICPYILFRVLLLKSVKYSSLLLYIIDKIP